MLPFKNLQTPFTMDDVQRHKESPFPDYFILEMMIQQSMITELMSTPGLAEKFKKNTLKRKCEKSATVLFNRGKRALEKNQFAEALLSFNEAIIAAPGSSKLVASCYISRSLNLQKMKAYPQSLEDIDRALKLSLSESQKEELLKRKRIIETLLSTVGLENLKLKNNSEIKETLSYGENEEIVGVSSAMNLGYNKKFGRHYVANQDIKIGDVLMIQKPFVHTPLPDVIASVNKSFTCDNCLEMTINPISCEKCVLTIYCSDTCKIEAFNKYHKMECEICERITLDSQIVPVRALMLATNQGEKFEEIFNLMAKIDCAEDRRKCGYSENGKLDGSKPETLLSLLTHTEKLRLTEMAVSSAIVADIIRRETSFLKRRNDYDTTLNLAILLLKISYCCTMNMYGIRGCNVEDKIALAMYPVFSYLNNSCANNAFWYDQKGQKILRACKNIKKGEQVCVSYLSTGVQKTTCAERKNFFQKVKFFTCHCEACDTNYDFKLELKGRLKVPSRIKKALLKTPNDTTILWELLELIHKECRGPSLEAKEIEIALANAHMGSKNESLPQTLIKLKLV